MELDITTLEYTYLFLKDLETQGFISYDLSFKIISKLSGKKTYISYNDLADFLARYSSLINDTKPNKYCIVGDFIFLENIRFINNTVSYKSNISFYNIADGNPKSKTDTEYNNYKNASLIAGTNKSVAYLKDSLITYFNKNTLLKTTREDASVDVCYVDPGYVGVLGYNPNDPATDNSGLE